MRLEPFISKKDTQKGQVFIIIILLFMVISIIVLAVSSRSITDIKISQTSEESARAFSAAEAGIEEAVEKIRANPADPGSGRTITSDELPSNAEATYTIAVQAGSTKAFLSPTQLISDVQTFQAYLADYLADPNLLTGNYSGQHICILWGDLGGDVAAIEATVIYKDTSVPPKIVSKRFAFDPSTRAGMPAPQASNCATNVAAADNNLGVDRTFAFAHKLSLVPPEIPGAAFCAPGVKCLQLFRIRLLFNPSAPQYVGVLPQGSETLPPQGYKIESTGSVPEGGTKRKVQVFQSFPSLPTIFDFAIFNATGPLNK